MAQNLSKLNNLSLPQRNAFFVAIVHLIFVLISIIPNIRGVDLFSALHAGDQVTYINTAKNIIEHRAFSREVSAPFLWEPYRTIGFPLIVAFSLLITKGLSLVLIINACFAGLAAYYGTKLLQLFNFVHNVQKYFGILLAFLPNALGLDSYILTDAIFAYLNLIWFFFLLRGIIKNNFKDLLFSSLVLIFAQLVKPTLSAAFIIIILAVFIMNYDKLRSINIKRFAIIIILSLIAPLFMSLMNYKAHHIFSTSLLGEETEREYLMVNYLTKKTGTDYITIQKTIRNQDRIDANNLKDLSKSIYGKLYTIKKERDDSIMHQDRLGVYAIAAKEFFKQLVSPEDICFNVFTTQLASFLREIGAAINLLLLLLFSLGFYHLYKVGMIKYAMIILIINGFYLTAGSLSARQGARLRLPADIVSLPIVAIGLGSVLKKETKI